MISFNKRSQSNLKGQHAEQRARQYLEQQGLLWRHSNYRCRMGEIDLIMVTPTGMLVFIEVRFRAQAGFGSAAESVTNSKQKKLLKAASHYLMMHPHEGHEGVRFDVLALDGNKTRITWIKQAFEEVI